MSKRRNYDQDRAYDGFIGGRQYLFIFLFIYLVCWGLNSERHRAEHTPPVKTLFLNMVMIITAFALEFIKLLFNVHTHSWRGRNNICFLFYN